METKNIYFKSDFELIEQAESGYSVPFRFRYFTASKARAYECSFDGTTYTNCKLSPDGTQLVIPFDHANLGIGTLQVEREYYLSNADFKDGICNEFIRPQNVIATDKTVYENIKKGGYKLKQVTGYANKFKIISGTGTPTAYDVLELNKGDAVFLESNVEYDYVDVMEANGKFQVGTELTKIAGEGTPTTTYTAESNIYVSVMSDAEAEVIKATITHEYEIALSLNGDKTITATSIVPSWYQKGPKGDKGDTGNVDFETLTESQLEQLTKPAIDKVTEWKDAGDLTGPKGDKGDKGDTGAKGADGKDGADGTVAFDNLTPQQKASLKGEKGDTGAPGPRGIQGQAGSDGQDGLPGATFKPSVSADGWISWTNESGKTNPDAVNIMGPKGDTGQRGPQGPEPIPEVLTTIGSTVADNKIYRVTNSGTFTVPAAPSDNRLGVVIELTASSNITLNTTNVEKWMGDEPTGTISTGKTYLICIMDGIHAFYGPLNYKED